MFFSRLLELQLWIQKQQYISGNFRAVRSFAFAKLKNNPCFSPKIFSFPSFPEYDDRPSSNISTIEYALEVNISSDLSNFNFWIVFFAPAILYVIAASFEIDMDPSVVFITLDCLYNPCYLNCEFVKSNPKN